MTDQSTTTVNETLYPKSGLVAAIERITGKELSKEQLTHWQDIQNTYGVSDEDPLVMVLILMGVHQHLFNEVPERIKEATERAIIIHRTTLEDQATIVAKNLLSKITPMFVEAVSAAGGKKPASAWNGLFGGATLRISACAFIAALLGTAASHFLFR